LSYFMSNDNAESVRDFYAQDFKRLGQVNTRPTDDGYVVSAFDIRTDTQKSIVIVRRDKGVIVFPSILPGELNTGIDSVPEDLPASPHAVRLSDVRSRDRADESAVVTYLEGDEPAVVARNIIERMEARGWKLSDRHDADGKTRSTTLQFRRGGNEAVASVSPLASSPGSAVMYQTNKIQAKDQREKP
jgi:hypothetical protein